MRILFVGIDLTRKDMVKSVGPACEQANCYFLENFNEPEVSESLAHTLGTVIFWKNYSDAVSLLQKIQPDKIIFQLIDNYYHISLFFAAKYLSKIPVWYMDHGIKYEHTIHNLKQIESEIPQQLSRSLFGKKIKSYIAFLKNSFFRNTKDLLPSPYRKLIMQIFNTRSKNNFAVFMQECGQFLQPDTLIVYSRETFLFYQHFFNLPDDYEQSNTIYFVGIPALDDLNWLKNYDPGKDIDYFLLIDQVLHEQSLMGWTEEKKLKFLIGLVQQLEKFDLKLKIKPHPWNSQYYDKLPNDIKNNILLIQDITPESIKGVDMVGSFNSTLLLAFCTSPSFKVMCFEMHPQVLVPSFSYGITKFGVAQEIKSFDELNNLILSNEQENLILKNNKIIQFTNIMLYKFDSFSSDRFTEAILQKS